ncbi:MAG: hypothetical protein ACI4HI_14405 [Lachnospiraceae bacterium]
MYAEKGTITRRMDTVLNGLQEEFRSMCDIKDFESRLAALKKAGNRSDRPSKLRDLFDLFDLCKIEYECGKDNAYYEKLVRNADIPTFSDIENRMLYALYERYKEYPDPEEYMERIVNRLESPEDGWQGDSLRLRILKRFIKYGNYLKDAGISGKKAVEDYVKEKLGKKPGIEEVLANIDDDIFSVLNFETENSEGLSKEEKKKQKERNKSARKKYELLKIADDLAGGKFRTEGATKKSLYLFAMVYEMTYYSGNGDILDPKTDIETNLFRDYYTNNFMRFISEEYKEKPTGYDLDPSGQGINYKNFAEMIYLYYISQDDSPQEKIRLSSEMIQEVQTKQFKSGGLDTKEKGGTVYYRRFFKQEMFDEDVFRLSQEEFKEFLLENYNCDTFLESRKTKTGEQDLRVGVFQLEIEQESAYKVYQSILQDIKELGLELENCNYGLWFTDVAALKKNGAESFGEIGNDIDRKKFQEFIDLLTGINHFVGYTVKEESSTQNTSQEWAEVSKRKTKALFVSSPADVTRTSVIVAYYYYYNALHEEDKGKSFEDVFLDFKRGVDKKLGAAYYQPLSGKNIFDVLITFSSYAYLRI